MSAQFTTYSGGLREVGDHIRTVQDYLNETIEKVDNLENNVCENVEDISKLNLLTHDLSNDLDRAERVLHTQDNLLLKIHNNFEAKVKKVAIIICIILAINSITLCLANAYKQHQINELKAQMEEIKNERERE